MNQMIDVGKEKLISDFKLVIADAEELLRATAGQAGEKAVEMRGRVEEHLARARQSLASAKDVAVEKAKTAGRATDTYVHENPWRSIGVAAGVGLVVGLLIGRR
jgi:ElaB/YqjD/DUF883 family membrane-anchored ribosome-binding protein